MKKSIILGIIVGIIVIVLITNTLFIDHKNGQTQKGYFTDYGCSGSTGCISGIVARVIDGDTLEINGTRIRLALTSTPELSEKNGIDAKDFTSKFCPVGSYVIVDEDDLQKGGSYGRTIGKVLCKHGMLNSALLESNLAYIDKRFCSTSEFSSEDWAKKHGC
ncbi:MAG: thermonuclease family protein [Candidatus Nitrosotenuis sp.]